MSLYTFYKRASGVAGANLASSALIAALNFILAAVLTKSDFGLFSVLFVLLNVGILISRFGMQTVIMRFGTGSIGSGDLKTYEKLRKFTLGMVLAGSVITTFVFIGYVTWSERADQAVAIAFGIALFLYSISGWSQGRIESLGKLPQAAFVGRVLPFFIAVMFLLGTWALGKGPSIFGVGVALAFGFGCAILAASTLFRGPKSAQVDEQTEPYQAKKWLAFGLSIMVVGLVQTGARFMDILMLDVFRTAQEVAVYSIAARIAEFVSFGIVACNIVVASSLLQLKEVNAQTVQPIFTNALIVTVSVAIAVAAMILPTAYFALPVLLEGYGGSFEPLLILAAGQIVSAVCGPVIFIVANLGFERDLLFASLAGLICNMTLNILLIPTYGVQGAALATAVGVVLVSCSLTFRLYVRIGAAPPTSAFTALRGRVKRA